MDIYETWELEAEHIEGEIEDLDHICRLICRSSRDDRIMKKILSDMYDTEDPIFILNMIGSVLGAYITKIEYTTDEDYKVSVDCSGDE